MAMAVDVVRVVVVGVVLQLLHLQVLCLLLEGFQGTGQALVVCPHSFIAGFHLLPPAGHHVTLHAHFADLLLQHAGLELKVAADFPERLHLRTWWLALSWT
jgi:hypothetical protein